MCRSLSAVTLLVVLLGCGGDGPTTLTAGPPAAMLIVSGDEQSAPVGTELPAPVVVRVTDAAGAPVSSQIVNFRVVAGGGSVFGGAAITNAAGEARERWTVGMVAGEDQRLEARAVDPATGAALVFAEFEAIAVPGAPSQLLLIAAAAGAASGEPFTTQPVVAIRDAAGNTIASDNNTVVTMTVSANGSVVGTATATAASGLSTFSNVGIRGTAGTTYTLSFVATGVTSATQNISLTAGAVATVTVSPASASLFITSEQLGAVATDADGNAVTGAAMIWTSSNEGVATVSGSGLVTPVAEGLATITATSGEKAGTAAVTVLPFSFTTLAGGSNHTCGLSSNGDAFCWGRNFEGQLGSGTTSDRTTPGPVQGGHIFTALTAWQEVTCGLTSGGAAYCWGYNQDGTLGNGANQYSTTTPTAVLGGLVFKALETSGSHTCGLTTAGAAYCWGVNGNGELGDGTTTFRSTPVAVQGGLVFTAITTGNDHSCGLTSSRDAYCWGDNDSGQLGDGTTAGRLTPVLVAGGLAFTSLNAGGFLTCGLTTAGAAYCWGEGGNLGDGTTSNRSSPVAVHGGHAFSILGGGNRHNCAATSVGVGYCWGDNELGPLGDGTTTNRETPVPIQGSIAFSSLFGGTEHTCGLTSAGTAYCWGRNGGAVGDGTTTTRLTPVAVRRR